MYLSFLILNTEEGIEPFQIKACIKNDKIEKKKTNSVLIPLRAKMLSFVTPSLKMTSPRSVSPFLASLFRRFAFDSIVFRGERASGERKGG